MQILSPPVDCKTPYIQGSEVLVVPTGVNLAPLCVKCGESTNLKIRKTFHWPPLAPGPYLVFGGLGLIAFILRRVFRFDTRIKLDIPICSTHRARQILRRWGGICLMAFGVGMVPFSVKAIDVRTPLEALMWGGTLAAIVSGFILLVTGVHILDLAKLDNQFAAYTGFGLEYMQKIPSDTEVFSPRRTEVTSNS
jgi:hypothetical protein